MKFRILLANCLFALLVWAAFWVLVTLITVGLGLTGRLTQSAWEVAAQLANWYALFVGVALIHEYMPLYLGHGRTRRQFAAEGAVKANVAVEPLEAINDVFSRMESGRIEGRIVLKP